MCKVNRDICVKYLNDISNLCCSLYKHLLDSNAPAVELSLEDYNKVLVMSSAVDNFKNIYNSVIMNEVLKMGVNKDGQN